MIMISLSSARRAKEVTEEDNLQPKLMTLDSIMEPEFRFPLGQREIALLQPNRIFSDRNSEIAFARVIVLLCNGS